MNDRVQQQALGVYQDVALLALDLLARVIAMRVDRGPPFSAALTLWLSMIAALGLALLAFAAGVEQATAQQTRNRTLFTFSSTISESAN